METVLKVPHHTFLSALQLQTDCSWMSVTQPVNCRTNFLDFVSNNTFLGTLCLQQYVELIKGWLHLCTTSQVSLHSSQLWPLQSMYITKIVNRLYIDHLLLSVHQIYKRNNITLHCKCNIITVLLCLHLFQPFIFCVYSSLKTRKWRGLKMLSGKAFRIWK